MKTYPKYKESGIPWIGQIPEGWELCKMKSLLDDMRSGGTPTSNNLTYYTDEGGLCWVAIGDMSTTDIVYNTAKHITEEGRRSKNLCVFPKGTMLYSIYASIGKVAELAVPATINQAILAIKLNEQYLQTYCKYVLRAQEKYVASLASANTQANLSAEKVAKFILPVPSLAEQQAIAEYLDKKTGDIDELVGLLNKQIADVRAYRQSLITETVTQGLNKDVPMKDSGIEWIGQIPKGWHLTKLKHLTSKIGSGITPTGGATIYQDSGILFIRSQNVYTDGLRLDDVAYISDEIDNNMQSSRVLYGDVLLNITGASIGRCTTFNLERTRANVNQHVCIIRPIAELLLSKYLQYTLNSNLGQTQIALYQTGGNREGLNFEQLKNFLIPDIPLSEQQQIVEFLDAKTKDIDELLSKLEAQVADLLAYKSSLISEVVTGKIDIR